MMNLKVVSPVYKGTLLKSALLLSLTAWAVSATWFGLQKKATTHIITLEDATPRLVIEDNEKALLEEKWKFVKRFFFLYYNYDAGNFDQRVGDASDVMEIGFWNRESPKVVEARKRVLSDPSYDQRIIKFERIKEILPDRFEAQFDLKVRERAHEENNTLKVTLDIRKHPRTTKNPWSYEVLHVSEQLLPKS